MTTIADLRETLTLQKPVSTDDGAGGQTLTWSTVATVKAKVMPVKGTESDVAGRIKTQQTYLVEMRYRSDVAAKWRALWGSKILNLGVPDNRDLLKRFTTIEAIEGLTE